MISRLAELTEGNEIVKYLCTILGIGAIRSATMYAEIGNIDRFKSPKALASYTGLISSVRASGKSIKSRGITKLSSRPLRHALVEAAINLIRDSPPLNRLLNRVLCRGSVQEARRSRQKVSSRHLGNAEAWRTIPASGKPKLADE